MSLPPPPPALPPPPPGPPGPPGPPPSSPPPAPYETYEPPRRSRVPLVLALVLGLVVIAAGVALPVFLGDDDPVAERVADADATGTTDGGGVDLSEVVTFTTLRSDHVTETVDDYTASPPAGGQHFPVWLDCGVYDEPVRDEFLVHDLEHGAFWFAYDAEALGDDEVAALAAQLPQNGVMTPYAGLDAPVVVTVWEAQLALDGVDDPRLPLFLDEYADGATAPEPFASCAGGATPDAIADLPFPTDITTG